MKTDAPSLSPLHLIVDCCSISFPLSWQGQQRLCPIHSIVDFCNGSGVLLSPSLGSGNSFPLIQINCCGAGGVSLSMGHG